MMTFIALVLPYVVDINLNSKEVRGPASSRSPSVTAGRRLGISSNKTTEEHCTPHNALTVYHYGEQFPHVISSCLRSHVRDVYPSRRTYDRAYHRTFGTLLTG